MALAARGIILPADIAPEVRNDISVLGINLFVNEFPVISRLPRAPVGTVSFNIRTHKDRPELHTLGIAIPDGAAIKITLVDASPVMPGDVFEQDSERLEVIDTQMTNVTLAANEINVRRGAEGTTPAAHATTTNAFKLVGNSRTGGEVDQPGIRMARTETVQYCQTYQFPVQTSGSVESTTVVGIPSVFGGDKDAQLRNLYRDMERTTIYGMGEAPGGTNSRPKQKGLKTQIVTNRTSTPTNAGAYKPTDLLRDTLAKCRAAGGMPDLMILSSDFLTGLSTWGQAITQVPAGETQLGVKINTYAAPFLGAVAIVEGFSLKTGTAIVLTSSKVRWRNKRNEFWAERGRRGDAFEGEWIAEGAVEVADEAQHAFVEGITAFAAP